MQNQLSTGHPATELAQHRQPLRAGAFIVHAVRRDTEVLLLGGVHRAVGLLEQGGSVRHGRVGHRDTDTDLDIDIDVPEPEWRLDRLPEPAGGAQRRGQAAHRGHQDGVLVRTQSGDRVHLSNALSQPGAYLHQQCVAAGLAESVVDLLESVEVEQQQSTHGALATTLAQRLIASVDEQGAVGQAGQRVVQRVVQRLSLLSLQCPPVAAQHHGEQDEHYQPAQEHDRRQLFGQSLQVAHRG